MKLNYENLKQLPQKLKNFWTTAGITKRLIVLGAFLLVIISGAFYIFSSGKDEYEVLFSDLSPKDAAAVTNKLKEDKIPYKLENEGKTVLVPAELKFSTRLDMAAEDIPQGHTGFEIFSTSSFGETQSDKKVKYQIALQGELARTIESLENVKAARVHLSIPEKTLYSDYEENPSASIQLTLQPNKSLTPKEIQGIKNLVANSVEGLEVDKVVLIDQSGNLISEEGSDISSQTEQVKQQLALKRSFEKEKKDAIQLMLDQTLGKGNAVVQVNVDLNFDNKEEKQQQFAHDPEGPFVVSEQVRKESGTEAAQNAQGIPGTDNEIPQYAEVQNGNGNLSYEKSDITRNYELNKIERVTKYAVGDTRYDSLTAAVLVNSRIAEKLGGNEAERINKVRDIVAAACGLKENQKNENVSVAFIDFYSEPVAEENEASSLEKLIKLTWLPWLIVLLAMSVFLIVYLLRRRRAALAAAEAMEADKLESGLEEALAREMEKEEIEESPPLTPEAEERQRIRREVDKLIEENPESAAQVIRAWLMEDQR